MLRGLSNLIERTLFKGKKFSELNFEKFNYHQVLWFPILVAPLRAIMDPPDKRNLWFARDCGAFLISLAGYFGTAFAANKMLLRLIPKYSKAAISCFAGIIGMGVATYLQGAPSVQFSHWMKERFFDGTPFTMGKFARVLGDTLTGKKPPVNPPKTVMTNSQPLASARKNLSPSGSPVFFSGKTYPASYSNPMSLGR